MAWSRIFFIKNQNGGWGGGHFSDIFQKLGKLVSKVLVQTPYQKTSRERHMVRKYKRRTLIEFLKNHCYKKWIENHSLYKMIKQF